MVKTQNSSSDVMATGMTVGPKQVRINQKNKLHDLMTQSNMAAPKIPQIRWVSILMRPIGDNAIRHVNEMYLFTIIHLLKV